MYFKEYKKIIFTKIEGLGNDYLFIEDWNESIKDPSSLSKAISDRHFGVGSDGIILLLKNQVSECDVRMRIFNSDGSEAEMCGNGVRGFAKYIFDRNLISNQSNCLSIQTVAGIIKTQVILYKPSIRKVGLNEAILVRVNVGEPKMKVFSSSVLGVISSQNKVVTQENIDIDGRNFQITQVTVGNPHCILFVDHFEFDYQGLGKKIENHKIFQPFKTNVEFIQKINDSEINFRVWERGSGETLGCGTGACAAVVACVMNGYTKREVKVHLKGGDLNIQWNLEDNHIYMEGPTKEVFSGEYIYEFENN